MAVHGNIRNLKPSQRVALEKLADRRLRQDVIVTAQLAERLAALSKETNRVIGVLIDRRGRVEDVIIGDHKRLYLPDIGRERGGGLRFRGVRLVRTTLEGRTIDADDIADLMKLQLDVVAAISVNRDGRPASIEWAHLIPDNPQRLTHERITVNHANALPEDFGDFIAELEAEFERHASTMVETSGDRAMLVYIKVRNDHESEQKIAELHELCRTAGVEVAETFVQARPGLDPRTGVGQGALEEVELRALQLGADMLVFGQDLEASQLRNITNATQLRVIDRTQLILDIFAQRAQSAVGKLQVELAQLKYMLPRLSGRGSAMSRLAGGIGGRGPGETKLENDRRRARDRVRALEERIEGLRTQREISRANRRANHIPVISIVGYTNAGKSTLLNTLTNSQVLSEDKLFATLDPTTRRLRVPSAREVVLTDTVGFIRDLPDALREAFRATLEELHEADLLLHLVDISDPAAERHMASTRAILSDLGLDATPRLLVYNKLDRLSPDDQLALHMQQDAVGISANDRESLNVLLEEIDRFLVNSGRGDTIPENAAHFRVLAKEDEVPPPTRPSMAKVEGQAEPPESDDDWVDFSN